MTWSTPRTWSVGEVVTAAMMNQHVRDNLNVIAGTGYGYRTLRIQAPATFVPEYADGMTALARDPSPILISNTTVETVVVSHSLVAGTLGPSGTWPAVRITLLARYTQNTAGTPGLTVKAKVNSAIVGGFRRDSIAAGAGSRAFRFTADIAARGVASSGQIGVCEGVLGALGSAATATGGPTISSGGFGVYRDNDITMQYEMNHGLVSATGLLQITAQHDTANASISFESQYYLVQFY